MKKLNLFIAGGLLLVAITWLLIYLAPMSGDLGQTTDPSHPEPVVDPSPGYLETRVYFATDRQQSSSSPVAFSGERGNGQLVYGQVSVSIPDSHEVGKIESPRWWKVWNRDDPSRYVLVLSVDTFDNQLSFAQSVKSLFSDTEKSDVLLFIHGYNVSFEAAAKRTAQLSYDLQFTGAPMFYSWPSKGKLEGYPADETSVVWTVPHFKRFLKTVLTDLGARNVHVIAHSMGNRALLHALSTFDTSTLPDSSAKLQQIILAAPDIDVGIFRQLAEHFPNKAQRITLYTSQNDRAIRVSKKFHDFPRAGGSNVIIDGIDTVDASLVNTDFLAHSYFGDSILSDIYSVIGHNHPPSKRFGLIKESSPDGHYWRFAAGAAN